MRLLQGNWPFLQNCPKFQKKKEMKDKNGKKPQRPTYPSCDTCGKKNHLTEECWQGAGAYLRPKRTRNDKKVNDESNDEGKSKKSNSNEASSSDQSSFIKPEPKN